MRMVLAVMFMSTFWGVPLGQVNYLKKGNQYLDSEKYAKAEKVFRDAIKSDSTDLTYRCQLSLALMNQGKHEEAEETIEYVLAQDSTDVGALWYGGMNSYLDKKGDLRKAVSYFERALLHLDKEQDQYYSANWSIGKAYQMLLQTDGLTYDEVSRMLECYSIYVQLQPEANDAGTISQFVQRIKENRAPRNVKKWISK